MPNTQAYPVANRHCQRRKQMLPEVNAARPARLSVKAKTGCRRGDIPLREQDLQSGRVKLDHETERAEKEMKGK